MRKIKTKLLNISGGFILNVEVHIIIIETGLKFLELRLRRSKASSVVGMYQFQINSSLSFSRKKRNKNYRIVVTWERF